MRNQACNSPVSNSPASLMKPLDTCEAGAKVNIRMRLTLYYRSYMFLNYSTCGTFKMVSFSKSEDNQYTSIEEIKRLKVQEPKTILSDHGQPVTGKKADLVHGFLVSLPYVSRLSRYPFLSKSNTKFAISPLFTKSSHTYRVSLGLMYNFEPASHASSSVIGDEENSKLDYCLLVNLKYDWVSKLQAADYIF